MNPENQEILSRVLRIKLLVMDCDGVLTDGRLWLTADGDEQKTFHVRDGQGISLFHRAGLKTAVISGRTSRALERRAQELNISFVYQSAKNKIQALEEIIAKAQVTAEECAFIGDDLADIPVMQRSGFAVAVADAVEETRQASHFVTSERGGQGAVREVCELILKAKGLWEGLLDM